ncbi:hypothetical protein IJT93_08850 [bacterium]|nr:hypothetical protein [bacterium]
MAITLNLNYIYTVFVLQPYTPYAWGAAWHNDIVCKEPIGPAAGGYI